MTLCLRNLLAFAVLITITSSVLQAETYLWTGNDGLDFDQPLNWSPIGVPDTNDTIQFGNAFMNFVSLPLTGTVAVDRTELLAFSDPVTFQGLNAESPMATNSLDLGQGSNLSLGNVYLTVNDDVTIPYFSRIYVAAGATLDTGVHGIIAPDFSGFDPMIVEGTLRAASYTADPSNYVNLNGGSIEITGAGGVILEGGTGINLGGQLDFGDSLVIAGTTDLHGSMTMTPGSSITTAAITGTPAGSLNFAGGTLQVTADLAVGGTATVRSSGQITVNSGSRIETDGTLTVLSSPVPLPTVSAIDTGVVKAHDIVVDGGFLTNAASSLTGTIEIAPGGSFTVQNFGTLSLRNYTLDGGRSINVGPLENNSMSTRFFSVGGAGGPGTITVNAGSILNVGSPAALADTLAINDGGLIDLKSGSSFFVGNNQVIAINAGGRLETAESFEVGSFAFAPAMSVTVSGADAELNVTGPAINVGQFAAAQSALLNVLDGGAINASSSTEMIVFPSGLLTIDDGTLTVGSLEMGHNLFMNFLKGTINLTDEHGLRFTTSGEGSWFTSVFAVNTNQAINVAARTNLNFGAFTLNGGTFRTERFTNGSGGTFTFDSGTLGITGTNGLTIGDAANPASLNALTLNEDRTLEVSHTTTINSGYSLTLDGGTLRTGSLVKNSGGSFAFGSGTLELTVGNFEVGGGAFGNSFTLADGKSVIISGGSNAANVASGAVFNVVGGSLDATRLENSGTSSFSGGEVQIANTDNNVGGLLVVEGINTLDAGAVSNDGEVLLVGPAATVMTTGFTNNNGGVIRGDGRIIGNVVNSAGGEIRAEAGKGIKVLNTATVANSGRVNLQGGTAEFVGNVTNAASGDFTGRGTLKTAQLTNQGDVALSSGITDVFGDVLNQTGGRITVSGNADVTFWDDVNHAGSLFRVSVGSSATFFGTYSGGSITGDGDKYFEADVSPGFSPASITLGGDVSLGAAAELVMELAGTTLSSAYDHITVGGQLSVGGVLNVALLGGFEPAAGDSFDLLDWGSIDGTFADLQLPELDGGLTWNTDDLYESGLLRVVAPGVTGDYNNDGTVDAADYVMWRKLNNTSAPLANDETPGTGDSDYGQWRTNFGETNSGSGGAAIAGEPAVPEPTTLVLLTLIAAGWSLQRRAW